jgi:hypothetical protein
MKTLGLLVLTIVACTRKNPDVCCVSADDCQAQELPFPTSCSDGRVCVNNLCTAQLDAGTDSMPMFCVGKGVYQVCLPTPPMTGVSLEGGTIDTDADPQCQVSQPIGWGAAGQPDACFIVGTSISVSGPTSAKGARPLVIVAADTLTISSTIDVSSSTMGVVGAGYSGMGCLSFSQTPMPFAGGAGGTLITSGGSGGANGTIQGGGPSSLVTVPVLRGGCLGQDGAGDLGSGGVGGTGGGVVYLVAGNSLALQSGAVINASGSGGIGGHATTHPVRVGGGGGGGSGGMIVLNATTISVANALLIANGGGGGAGNTSTSSAAINGLDPNPSQPASPALGGSGPAGAGGNGYAGGIVATGGANDAVAGGGGGGGAGYIQANHPIGIGGNISPPATIVP